MAYVLPYQDDKFNTDHVVLKQAKSGYTPVVGDLVIFDATVAHGVDLIAADEVTVGLIISLNNMTDGTKLSVQELTPGSYIVLPYTGTVAKGDKVEFSSATHGTTIDRTQVKTDNTNGGGYVTAIDADTAAGTGHCIVRF